MHSRRQCRHNIDKMSIQGFIKPGYEPVYEKFLQHHKDGLEDNAQVCVYTNGIKVVDLYTTNNFGWLNLFLEP